MSELKIHGNLGYYVDDGNVITFQVGTDPGINMGLQQKEDLTPAGYKPMIQSRWLNIEGLNVYARGQNNQKCEQIERDIKNNRLLPRLISKQINMLYGKGAHIYKKQIKDGKIIKEWVEQKTLTSWLESWKDNGLEMSYSDFGLAVIRRHYFFRDFFVKHRMTRGKIIGRYPIAGSELVENRNCRLATTKRNVADDFVEYNDFKHVVVGNWQRGAYFKVYPLFDIRQIDSYNFAAISHHRENSVGEFYGENETHEGVKTHLKTSNELPIFIDSFLNNSLAAKIHVIIPNAWLEAKRKQISAICNENAKRKKNNESLFKYNGIDVGTEFRESFVIRFMKEELRRLGSFLSGKDNQGKAYATLSFRNGQSNEEERWKIETVDLKYKEYISSLIEYDKHINDVLLGSVGMDASISSVSKDGVISKSGADVYYNYLLYLMSLTPDDEKCSEPYNLGIQANFPSLYNEGFRVGFYRETPARQEEVSTDNRLNKQQS